MPQVSRAGFIIAVLFVARAECLAQPRLSVQEVGSIQLPSGFQTRGAQMIDSVAAVVWSERVVLRVSTSGPHVIASDAEIDIRGVHYKPDLGQIELIDAARKELITIDHHGLVLSRHTLRLDGRIIQAIRVGHDWLFEMDASASSERMIVAVAADGRPITSWLLRELPRTGQQSNADIGGVRLQAIAYGILLSELRAPFRVWKATPDGQWEQFTALDGPVQPWQSHNSPADHFVALAIVSMDNHLVQQFADLTSDTRILVTRNMVGELQRSASINAALAFLATHPTSKTVLAIRDTGLEEVVFYRWHWLHH